jgi:hypothetical protein
MSEMPTPAELRARATELQGLREQAAGLRLHWLLAHWSEAMAEADAAPRVAQWLAWETQERGRLSLERRLREAHIGRFKPLADFDWSWPAQCDRAAIEELMTSNEAAVRELGDATLKRLAVELTQSLRRSVTVDWARRETVRRCAPGCG